MATDPSIAFAKAFDSNFRKSTWFLSHNEIPLFRALHSTLARLSNAFCIEEYHGGGRQVTFTGNGSFARNVARCELSDLMIVSYSSSAHVRVTYMQAKSERATLGFVCGRHFSANLEQWYLLSSRPQIFGIGSFNPPPDLLSSSLLPSVGSFVFFIKVPIVGFQTYYASAGNLVPAARYTQRHGKVQVNRVPCPLSVTSTSGYDECLAACGNIAFAQSLYRLQIGTPLHQSVPQSYRTRNWLAAHLRRLVEEAKVIDRPTPLAEELIGLLAPETDNIQYGSFGAKNLIILRSNHAIESDC